MKNVFLLIMLMTSMSVGAQYQPITDAPTPNASELARYGNIPVSYYTGKPDISIPICDWEIKGVKMPIKLVYDATGVPINSLPGWVGSNWSVQGGGVITRTLCGSPDEFVPRRSSQLQLSFTNYFHAYSKLSDIMSTPNRVAALEDSVYNINSNYDYAPDIFHFNFMGKSGRFFLGNDGEWKVQSDENIQVVFDINDENNFMRPFIDHFPKNPDFKQPMTIKGFMLRDENGTCYYFGGNVNAIDYSLNFTGMGDKEEVIPWLANSWYLTKVEDRHGNRLFTLNYSRGKFVVQFYPYFYYHVLGNYSNGILANGNQFSSTNHLFPFSIIFTSPVYLGCINGADGKSVDFSSSDMKFHMNVLYPDLFGNIWALYEMLDGMIDNAENQKYYYLQTDDPQIRQYQYKPDSCNLSINPLEATCLRRLNHIYTMGFPGIRDFDFEYSYTGRVHLTDIVLSSWEDPDDEEGAGVKGKYELRYNQYDQLATANYQDTRTDAWGYFSVLDNIVDYGYGSYILRDVDTISSQYGMLTEIVYPTGGRSVFEYEQNDYSKCMSLDRQIAENISGYAGGLRIKSITEYDGENTQQILSRRTYSYDDPSTGLSSGQLFSKPKNFWHRWKIVYDNSDFWSYVDFFQASSIIPLSNSFGPHIGYSYVRETFSDGTSDVYHYTNIADFPDQPAVIKYNTPNNNYNPTPFDQYSERGYKRGKLLSVTKYDDAQRPIQKTIQNYGGDDESTEYVWTSNLFLENFGESAAFIHINGGVYKLYYSKYDPIGSTTTTYFNNGDSIVDRTVYTKVNIPLNVAHGNNLQSVKVRLLKTKDLYRGDEHYRYNYSYPHEVGSTLEQRLVSDQYCLTPLLIEESLNGTLLKKHRTTYAMMNNRIHPKSEIEWHGSCTQPDTLITYYSYNDYGTPSCYRKKGQPRTYLTWIQNGNYIVESNTGNHLTSYTYDYDYNVTSITYPNGNIVYYEYDPMGRLRTIRNKNEDILKSFIYNYKKKN